MTTVRIYMEKLLFPGWSRATQRRHMRFLMLAVLLGSLLCVALAAGLYLLNHPGHN